MKGYPGLSGNYTKRDKVSRELEREQEKERRRRKLEREKKLKAIDAAHAAESPSRTVCKPDTVMRCRGRC